MSVDILGTSCDQCRSMVQYSFTSTETRRLVRTDSPGRPPRLSHSSWTMKREREVHDQDQVSIEKTGDSPPRCATGHRWACTGGGWARRQTRWNSESCSTGHRPSASAPVAPPSRGAVYRRTGCRSPPSCGTRTWRRSCDVIEKWHHLPSWCSGGLFAPRGEGCAENIVNRWING